MKKKQNLHRKIRQENCEKLPTLTHHYNKTNSCSELENIVSPEKYTPFTAMLKSTLMHLMPISISVFVQAVFSEKPVSQAPSGTLRCYEKY